jgi:hypothetical protein
VSDQRVQEFWGRFVVETGVDGEHTAFGFGSDAEMATELGLLVRDGPSGPRPASDDGTSRTGSRCRTRAT